MNKTKTKTTTSNAFNVAKYEKNGVTAADVWEVKDAFDLFDGDRSGQIDITELKRALDNLGIDVKNDTLTKMMHDIDTDNSGTISFDEFMDMMTSKPPENDSKEELEKVFNLFLGDDVKADKINIKHLRRVARDMNEHLSDEEFNEMIIRADLDKDGEVDFDEFYNIMTRKTRS